MFLKKVNYFSPKRVDPKAWKKQVRHWRWSEKENYRNSRKRYRREPKHWKRDGRVTLRFIKSSRLKEYKILAFRPIHVLKHFSSFFTLFIAKLLKSHFIWKYLLHLIVISFFFLPLDENNNMFFNSFLRQKKRKFFYISWRHQQLYKIFWYRRKFSWVYPTLFCKPQKRSIFFKYIS